MKCADRRWALLLAGVLLLALSACPRDAAGEWPPLSTLVLKQGDRILVLAPHPDDEVLGCGGILQEAAGRGLPLRVAFLTNGDNNELSFILYRKHPVLMPGAVRGMGEMRRPVLYPYLVHYKGWPQRVKNPLRETLAPPSSLTHLSWSSFTLSPGQITVGVPLEALGAPDRVLSTMRTTLADVSLDWVSWRVLELGGK